MVPRKPRLYFLLTAKFGKMKKISQVVLVLNIGRGHREQLRLGTMEGQERPLVTGSPGLKGSGLELRIDTM